MNYKVISKQALISLLETTLEAVKNDDSFQGNIYYEASGPEDFYVEAVVRVGNLAGQGSSIVITGGLSE
jgi:hypothetical protein